MKDVLNKFEKGKVILLKELLDLGLSQEDIDILVSTNELCKCTQYEGYSDIFYINNPIEIYGVTFNTVISPYEIIEALYMGKNNEFGFLYGVSALSRFGACNQVPFVTEICTTVVDDDKELVIEGQKFILYSYKKRYDFEYTLKSIGVCTIDILFNKYYKWFDSNPCEVFDTIVKNFNICKADLDLLADNSDFLLSLVSKYTLKEC